jgi:hypothetical protein
MRFTQVLTEIGRLTAKDWTGVGSMSPISTSRNKMFPLPGGSGLLYSLTKRAETLEIAIIDPKAKGEFEEPLQLAGERRADYQARVAKMQKHHSQGLRKIAQLSLYKSDVPVLKNAYSVDTITTDPNYRGMGLSKALYGIVLSVLKYILVAGESQTPGGRLNWVSLSRIPGIEIKGLLSIDDREIEDKGIIDTLMQLGGHYAGEYAWPGHHSAKDHYWVFDVQAGEKEMMPAVKSKLSKLYDSTEYDITMFATFAG